jgi:hypothetical protein
MSWQLEVSQRSPAGPLSCLDVAWGELQPQPLLFALDATLSAVESTGTRPPRARLLDCLEDAWSCLRELAPLPALEHLADVFYAHNQQDPEHHFHASAAMVRLSADGLSWDAAECGDTRIFRNRDDGGGLIFKDLPLPADHRVSGALGSGKQVIRHTKIPIIDGEGLSLLTDGAYHLLARSGLVSTNTFSMQAWFRFNELKAHASDDATFLNLSPKPHHSI